MGRFARVMGLAGVVVSGACNGFPDAIPIAEAELKPEKYPSYEALPAAPLISTEGQRWLILQGSDPMVPPGLNLPIASGGAGELSVSRLDRLPYDQLYARTPAGDYRIAAEIR